MIQQLFKVRSYIWTNVWGFSIKEMFFTVVMLMTVWYVKVMFDDFSVALKRLPEKAV